MKLKSIICIAIKCCRNLALPCKLSDHANENRWICIFVLSLFFLTVFLFQEFGCRVPTEIWQPIVLVSNKRMLLWWAINWVSLCKTWLPMGETNIIGESEKVGKRTILLMQMENRPVPGAMSLQEMKWNAYIVEEAANRKVLWVCKYREAESSITHTQDTMDYAWITSAF